MLIFVMECQIVQRYLWMVTIRFFTNDVLGNKYVHPFISPYSYRCEELSRKYTKLCFLYNWGLGFSAPSEDWGRGGGYTLSPGKKSPKIHVLYFLAQAQLIGCLLYVYIIILGHAAVFSHLQAKIETLIPNCCLRNRMFLQYFFHKFGYFFLNVSIYWFSMKKMLKIFFGHPIFFFETRFFFVIFF